MKELNPALLCAVQKGERLNVEHTNIQDYFIISLEKLERG